MDGQRVVIPLDPPANSNPGDRVFVEGYSHEEHGGNSLLLCFFWMIKILWDKPNQNFVINCVHLIGKRLSLLIFNKKFCANNGDYSNVCNP